MITSKNNYAQAKYSCRLCFWSLFTIWQKKLYEFLVGKNGKSMDTKKLVNIQYTYLKRLKIVRCQLEIPTLQVLTENNSTISKRLCKFGLWIFFTFPTISFQNICKGKMKFLQASLSTFTLAVPRSHTTNL